MAGGSLEAGSCVKRVYACCESCNRAISSCFWLCVISFTHASLGLVLGHTEEEEEIEEELARLNTEIKESGRVEIKKQ